MRRKIAESEVLEKKSSQNKAPSAEVNNRKETSGAQQGNKNRSEKLTQELITLLDAIPDNLVFLSPDMRIMWANKAAASVFGKDVFELIGQNCFSVCGFAPDDNYPSIKSFRTGQEVTAEVSTPDGRIWDVRVFPLKDKSGRVKNVIELARDITAKAHMDMQQVLELKNLSDEITSLKQHLLTDKLEYENAFSSIITNSKKIRAVFHYVEAIAKSQKPVFITGETGVGKELIAKAIHHISGVTGTFVAVNLAGLDDTMFSDTLFGHKKGAFTGADKDRDGLIVQASGGSLLLDEIGDLSESSQVKLLRLLEERTYYPLGSDILKKSNARIIASTNRDIQKQISEGKFRKDLYYRLCSHHIHIPPLRERLEDIPLLIDYFLGDAADSLKKKKPTPPPELITLLSNYNFPGNVRELQAIVFDAVTQHKSGVLSLNSFKKFIKQEGPLSQPGFSLPGQNANLTFDIPGHLPNLKDAKNSLEDYLISEALKRSKGNQGIAASLLGITRHALNKRLKRKNNL